MKITLIAAMDKNGLIGNNNKLPWTCKEDMQRFKNLTEGKDKAVLMGRKTFESIGKILPGRLNIIVTSKQEDCVNKNVVRVTKPCRGYIEAAERGCKELFIIGGASIYKHVFELYNMFPNMLDYLELTEIAGEYEGDTYFPEYDKQKWKLVEKVKGSNYTFRTFKHNS